MAYLAPTILINVFQQITMESESSYMDAPDHSLSSSYHDFPTSPSPKIPSSTPAAENSPHGSTKSELIVPAVTSTNPYAQGPDGGTYYLRENRYFGPASTWLSWTEQERTVIQSLDRVRSLDLSVHLIKAAGLKRKAQTINGPEGKRNRKGKENAESKLSCTDEDDGIDHSSGRKSRISLPKSWTAWPMPPEQVPREELLPYIFDNGRRRVDFDNRPSANLEEWLIATATRIARETWKARWGGGEMLKPILKREKAADAETKSEPAAATEHSIEVEGEGQNVAHEGPIRPPAQSGPEPVMFYSQPIPSFEKSSSLDSAEDDNESDTSSNLQPEPIGDDEKASRYFIPSARHILSKLDDLLLGLHKTRYAYAARPYGRANGKTSQSQTPDESHSRGRSVRSRSLSRRRGRNARSSSANTDVSLASVLSVTSSGRRSRRVENLGLRDWSDVMGMASLIGWDPAIIERASERCARLFRENMLFRTFYEGDVKQSVESQFTERLADARDGLAESDEEEEVQDASEADEEAVVILRISRACMACSVAKSLCEPADDQIGTLRSCKSCLDTGVACSGINVNSAADERVCPHIWCPRHIIPFQKRYHLQRHLDVMHMSHSVSRERSRARGAAPKTSDDDDDMVSSPLEITASEKHEIICPVRSCPRAKKPFSQGKRLYEHIRRMHPEMDIEKVKKQQALKRAEKRGTWRDERRHRSKSRSGSKSKSKSRGRSRERDISRGGGSDRTMGDFDDENSQDEFVGGEESEAGEL